MYEDPQNPPAGDSAWFIIAVDDIDSIEKSYPRLNSDLRQRPERRIRHVQ